MDETNSHSQQKQQQEPLFSPSAIAADMQRRTRKQNNFDQVEADLPDPQKLAAASAAAVTSLTPGFTTRLSLAGALSFLGRLNPLGPRPVARGDVVWLLDNTAYRTGSSRFSSSWEAEFVAAVFEEEPRSHLVDAVAGVARVLGIADDAEERKTIQARLIPFVWDVRAAKTVTVAQKGSGRRTIKLGPTGFNGVSSNVMPVASHSKGASVEATAGGLPSGVPGLLGMQTYYAGPTGWSVISDIDDTIKVTTTSDPIGILRETFVEEPRAVSGMPELYKSIDGILKTDTPWFYLSASPYNLYPFLREFRDAHYPPGTLILRDTSWRTIAGLLAALTMGTEEYKVDRMKKIHGWLPKRKMIVIGDSTQSDPEAYGEIYRTFPGWIRLILIRKATDTAMFGLGEKNEPARFEKAFKDIPREAWHVFEDPNECVEIVQAKVKQG
ncbi:hypothetical protein ISF_03507 [Cordyceps fumosorosea ARSEF 2679]|uniref:Phosphatidate phosphatase APP1 catalytic domain-containing protein n=1 Tax=Cordyceps fumosorosea (strain ARSEF 2679) TaxID=1081104 RepID=A0A162JHN4_CORFA|nr:hypothetical protein ISF_03507 [Cordyceps fumosorosea ARSEF 2679]OAA69132.1 hypothetical protein ISF_03507 [Cordyceps fumosorosea ARSEF 2679]